MCLYTNKERLETADRDITVYKLIEVDPGWKEPFQCARSRLLGHPGNYSYLTYYVLNTIDNECVENGKPYKAEGVARRRRSLADGYAHVYTTGLVHTLAEKDDAIALNAEYPDMNGLAILYRCTIPKGTKYVEGVEDTGYRSYASKQIVFEEPVFFWKTAKEWHKAKNSKNTRK